MDSLLDAALNTPSSAVVPPSPHSSPASIATLELLRLLYIMFTLEKSSVTSEHLTAGGQGAHSLFMLAWISPAPARV